VLALSTKILLMLFFQSLTYDFTSPDDGSCEAMTVQADCLLEKSPFGTGQSKCSWYSDADSSGGSCSFIQPSDSFTIVLYVAIFSTIASTPIDLLLNRIIHIVLAPPTRTVAVSPISDKANSSVTNLESVKRKSHASDPEILKMMKELSVNCRTTGRRLTPTFAKNLIVSNAHFISFRM